MAHSFRMQVPADLHSLVQLICKFGIVPGPMKAANITDDGQVNIWFVSAMGAATIKRASARLVKNPGHGYSCPRRVYHGLRVQNQDDLWLDVKDEHYRAAGLLSPEEYSEVQERR